MLHHRDSLANSVTCRAAVDIMTADCIRRDLAVSIGRTRNSLWSAAEIGRRVDARLCSDYAVTGAGHTVGIL